VLTSKYRTFVPPCLYRPGGISVEGALGSRYAGTEENGNQWKNKNFFEKNEKISFQERKNGLQ